jgi:RNA polymerase sigma-70 factor (ECF subfamily)
MPCSRSLLRVARRLTSDPSAAEDLVQEALLRAWRSFHQFRQDTNARAWLFRIMMNAFHAQGRRIRFAPTQAPVRVEPVAEASEPDVWGVARALGELAVEHRTVLLLGVVEGFTCREMADILEIPMGTVMSRLSRARAALRERLKPSAACANKGAT